jgi:uncharacterized protein (TIGR02271 family)
MNPLPLQATQTRTEQRWTVRLPVRAEQVNVSKQVVVRERVLVHRRAIEDVARVEGQVSREVLRLETQGEVEVGMDRQSDTPPRSR